MNVKTFVEKTCLRYRGKDDVTCKDFQNRMKVLLLRFETGRGRNVHMIIILLIREFVLNGHWSYNVSTYLCTTKNITFRANLDAVIFSNNAYSFFWFRS